MIAEEQNKPLELRSDTYKDIMLKEEVYLPRPKREKFERFQELLPESHGRNLALTVAVL